VGIQKEYIECERKYKDFSFVMSSIDFKVTPKGKNGVFLRGFTTILTKIRKTERGDDRLFE